jgi:hypothetical protein
MLFHSKVKMFKPASGRKPENGVWKYFVYEASIDKSKCQIDSCDTTIKGKNATNLVNHLKSKHKSIAAELEVTEKSRRRDQTTQSQLKVIEVDFVLIKFV